MNYMSCLRLISTPHSIRICREICGSWNAFFNRLIQEIFLIWDLMRLGLTYFRNEFLITKISLCKQSKSKHTRWISKSQLLMFLIQNDFNLKTTLEIGNLYVNPRKLNSRCEICHSIETTSDAWLKWMSIV